MANFITFEKLAEFAPIEGLLEGMKNHRLYSEVDGAINLLEQATSDIPERTPVLSIVAPEATPNSAAVNTGSIENVQTQSDVSVTEVQPAAPEATAAAISPEEVRQLIQAIYQERTPEFQIPDELKAA